MPCSSRSLPLFLLGLAALLLAAPALGAVGRWTPFGPPTGEIQEVLADPAVPRLLYALTKSGVYRSTDGGATWGSAGAGLPRGITALALDAQRPGTLWAADSFAVFRSRDRGAHWKRVSGADFQPFPPPGPSAGRVLLAVLPGDPAVLFYAGQAISGLWRSADGGHTWSALPEIRDLFLLETDPAGRVYAVQLDGTFWSSDDTGLHWRRLATLPAFVHGLAASPGRRTTLYAANDCVLLRSRNQGVSWKTILTAPEGGPIQAFAVDPQRPETVYVAVAGGVRISDDSGASWHQMPARPPVAILRLLIEPSRRALYGISHWDLASSQDQGRTWTRRGVSGRVPTFDSHLRFAPAEPARIFAVTGGRLFLSQDEGRTWRHLPVRAPSWDPEVFGEVTDLAFDPARPHWLYTAASGRLLLSRDDGRTWTLRSTPEAGGITRIALPLRSYLVAAGWGLFLSSDRGQTWTETLSGEISTDVSRVCDQLITERFSWQPFFARCHLVLFGDGEPISYGTAIWRSQDGGRSWTELPDLRGVAFGPAWNVYGWTWEPGPLLRSQDSGLTWGPAGPPEDHGWSALQVDNWSPYILYGATNDYPMRLKRSRDYGSTWEPLQAGLEGVVTWADGLWAHPAIPHQIYVVVDGGAFYEARFPEE